MSTKLVAAVLQTPDALFLAHEFPASFDASSSGGSELSESKQVVINPLRNPSNEAKGLLKRSRPSKSAKNL